MDANEKALKVLEYIERLHFSSFGDFIAKAIKDGKYEWIRKDLGELSAYMIVCDKLQIMPDENILSELKN